MCRKIENILITGASSGIGEALALYYAEHGAVHMFLCGRNAKRLQDVQKRCQVHGADVQTQIVDVTDQKAMEKWIKDCHKKAKLNLVIANAGVSTGAETSENVYNTFETNVMGSLNTIMPAIELFKKRQDKDKIIAITSSIAGYHGLSACPSYSATKACLKAYGEGLRNHLKPYKIQVSVICPGFVKSRITDKNTCPMPFFMPADKAAKIIATRIKHNCGLIAFPWPMRLATWLLSVLPNRLSDFIYAILPHKV